MNLNSKLDTASNRKSKKYSNKELIRRIVWLFGKIIFRYSPRVCFKFRASVLRMFGAHVGNNVHIYNTACIYMPWNLEIGDWSCIGEDVLVYNLGRVIIGSSVTVSHKTQICAGTHDYTDSTMPLLKPAILIEDQAWLCSDCFIGPGVTIGEGSIVGARATVVRDVSAWDIVAGNPARTIGIRKLKK